MGAMDELINAPLVAELRSIFAASGALLPTRRSRRWAALAGSGRTLQDNPLRSRVDVVRDAVIADTEGDFDVLANIVTNSLRQERFRGWMIWPVSEAVARLAVDASGRESERVQPGPFEAGLELMRQMTHRLSAEFALRIFLDADAPRAVAAVTRWCADPNDHVRRLASEGTRSYLPWGKQVPALHLSPSLTVPIVDALYRDDSAYVRRSVANHVNDLSRRHPRLAVEIGKRWLADPDHNTHQLVKRSFRTLVKRGDQEALAALGFAGDPQVVGPLLDRSSVRVGGAIEVRAILTNTDLAAIRMSVDFVVNYRKARGRTAAKVFKMATVNLGPGETVEIARRRPFELTSTRVLYPGAHSVELQINGRRYGRAEFELTL